jgi:translation initiation factor 5A
MPTKVRIMGKDIFNDSHHEMFVPTSSTVQIPIVKKTTYTYMDIGEDLYVSMMDSNGTVREDLKLNTELYNKLEPYLHSDNTILLTCLSAVNKEEIIDFTIEK